ncbi:insulinase family protein [Pyxidicoccus parkwayensis]|uniref:Insulinase family protein n=1 Tax=Pyxidicoccus parkwayensis TaxID=2813578 RepID=A0ABX7P1U8_9BACT|nr:M16 family metallopeptidase [Pyxidicoccus parkwaysis]QSQ24202.1 insulinase family protein [Pyxidicoccus parkwaysis]
MHSRPPSPSRARRPRAVTGALVLLSLLVGACTTLPPRGQVMMRDVSFPLRDFRMPSGLRVVVEEDRRSPVVAVVAVIGAGGSSDPSGKEGLAHMVEHLTFRSRHAGSPSIQTRLESAGVGHSNASTSLDYTAYEALAPKEALPSLLKMHGQWLASPVAGVTPEVFAVEREVVRNELRQRNETGYIGQVFSWMNAASFPAEHPYSRPLGGTHATLSALTLGDAQRFARTHYRPDNVTLVISGDVDLAAVEPLLRENLPASWMGTGAPLAVEPRLPAKVAETPLVPVPKSIPEYAAAVPTPELYLSWVLPRGFDEASAVQDFVRATLAPNLWESMRGDGDIAGIGTGLIPGTRASLLVVRVQLSRGDNPKRSAEKVLDQVHKAWAGEGGAGEVLGREADFQAMRRDVVTGMVLESEELLARTKRRALLTHFTLDVRSYTRSQMALMALGGSQVTDFAYSWLQRERAHVIFVRPGESGTVTAEAAPALPASQMEAAMPMERATPSMVNALSSPVHVLKLENGMEVLLAPRPGLPVVRVGAAMGGGTSYGAKPGVADVAAWTSFRESFFEGRPSDWGLHPSGGFEKDQVRVGLSGTAGNVGNILAMLAEQLSTTRTSEAYVRFLREQMLPWRDAVDLRPEEQANRALMGALYGTHPYAHETTGAEMAKVSWSEAQDWIEDVYRPGNTVVVIAGEFDLKEVEPLVRKYLGGWSRGKPEPVALAATPALPAASARPNTLFTARPGATQGQVHVACRLPAATPESEARYAMMSELLDVQAWHDMRSSSGASYGFQSRTWLGRGGAAHLLVEGMVDSRRMNEGVGSVRKAMAGFAKSVSAVDLEQARSRLLARQAVSFISTSAWVDALLDTRVHGFAPEALAQRPAHLQAVTAESLQKEFAGCLERLVVAVTADEAPGRAALQALSTP